MTTKPQFDLIYTVVENLHLVSPLVSTHLSPDCMSDKKLLKLSRMLKNFILDHMTDSSMTKKIKGSIAKRSCSVKMQTRKCTVDFTTRCHSCSVYLSSSLVPSKKIRPVTQHEEDGEGDEEAPERGG